MDAEMFDELRNSYIRRHYPDGLSYSEDQWGVSYLSAEDDAALDHAVWKELFRAFADWATEEDIDRATWYVLVPRNRTQGIQEWLDLLGQELLEADMDRAKWAQVIYQGKYRVWITKNDSFKAANDAKAILELVGCTGTSMCCDVGGVIFMC